MLPYQLACGLIVSLALPASPPSTKVQMCQSNNSARAEASLEAKLARPITFDFEFGPLREALNLISERYDVNFYMDDAAFAEKYGIPAREMDKQSVRLPALKNVPVRAVLKRLLSQVRATYRIDEEDNVIDIIPIR